jgi:hypothetical protein
MAESKIMELIEITAQFDKEGRITPLDLIWNGRKVPVISTGRRWNAEDGMHILAMLPGDQVVELLFIPQEGRWYLRPVGHNQTIA